MQEKTPPFTNFFPLKQQVIAGITVSYEDSTESLSPHFSPEEAKEFASLVCQAQIRPREAFSSVLNWKEKKKKHPALDNLLAFLYLQNKELEKAEHLILESYQNYPDYFFAKINFADQCLRKKQTKEIPLIFPTFDLSRLFPHRKSFHVSEFRGFMIILSRYHRSIGQVKEAQKYYEHAYTADPSHPSVFLLEKELFRRFTWHKSLLLLFKFFRVNGKNFRE